MKYFFIPISTNDVVALLRQETMFAAPIESKHDEAFIIICADSEEDFKHQCAIAREAIETEQLKNESNPALN